MDISEKELQKILMDREYFYTYETKFNKDIKFVECEYKIGEERIDILGVDDCGNLYVIELKKGIIDGDAFVQALSYTAQLKFMLRNNEIKIKTILVGNSIEYRTENSIIGMNDICFIEYTPVVDVDFYEKTFNKEFYDEDLKNTVCNLIEICNEHAIKG